MKLYKAIVGRTCESGGVCVHVQEASAVDVDGQLYADPHGGQVLLIRGEEWHEDRHDALRDAASRIAGMASVLTEQSERLREEANGV